MQPRWLLSLLLLAAAPQAASRTCYHAARSGDAASAKILQVVDHVSARLDRVPLLELYRPFFAGQLFLIPPGQDAGWAAHDTLICHDAHPQCVGRFFSLLTSSHYASDGRTLDEGYGAAAQPCTERVAVSGVLYHHLDMFVSPEKLLQLNGSLAWALERGLGEATTLCASGETLAADKLWGWHDDSRTTGVAAVNALLASPSPPLHWEAGKVCRGQADLYYVPVGWMSDFSAYAPFFANVYHEVSLQTILYIVGAQRGEAPLPAGCAGTCCSLAGDDLSNMTCGHRVDLADARVREQMQAILTATHPRARVLAQTPLLGNDFGAFAPSPERGPGGSWLASCAENRSACLRPWQAQEWGGEPLWDRARLARAAVLSTSADAWRPLLARLQTGQPVTVVVVGSSIVEGGAGCFLSGPAALAHAGVLGMSRASERRLDEHGRCANAGFAALFLAAVNATWPHPDHVLINLGRGGVDLGYWAGACLDSLLPTAGVDVLMFETHTAITDDAVEAQEMTRNLPLLGRIARRQARPLPLLMLAAAPFAPQRLVEEIDPGMHPFAMQVCMDAEGGHGQRCLGGAAGDTEPARRTNYVCTPEMRANLSSHVLATQRLETMLVGRGWAAGWSVLSLRAAVAAGLRDGAAALLGWSECEWVNAFYRDEIHPGQLGFRVIADAMLQATVLVAQAAEATSTAAPPAMHTPLSAAQAAQPAAVFAPTVASAAERMCTEAEQLSVTPLTPDGWRWVDSELVKGKIVWKPGWIANASGAEAELSVRTLLPGGGGGGGGGNVVLSLLHLTSYEHMGVLGVSCVAGCVCEPTELDAHVDGGRVSVERRGELAVSQAELCTLRLRVLDRTSSGERKWKLTGVTVDAAQQQV